MLAPSCSCARWAAAAQGAAARAEGPAAAIRTRGAGSRHRDPNDGLWQPWWDERVSLCTVSGRLVCCRTGVERCRSMPCWARDARCSSEHIGIVPDCHKPPPLLRPQRASAPALAAAVCASLARAARGQAALLRSSHVLGCPAALLLACVPPAGITCPWRSWVATIMMSSSL